MSVWIIYKQLLEKRGLVKTVEVIETCPTEQDAMKYSKLYNLQVPGDLKDRINYHYFGSRVQ